MLVAVFCVVVVLVKSCRARLWLLYVCIAAVRGGVSVLENAWYLGSVSG